MAVRNIPSPIIQLDRLESWYMGITNRNGVARGAERVESTHHARAMTRVPAGIRDFLDTEAPRVASWRTRDWWR